jgi:dolichol kinase
VLVLLIHYNILNQNRLIAVLAVGIITAAISKKYNIPIISWFLKHLDREGVRFPGEGPVFFVLGALIVTTIFPKNIALASIMILTLGDAFSNLFGKTVGKRKVRKKTEKTVEGMFAGIITGFLGALVFVDVVSAFLGSLTAMVFEAIELKVKNVTVDDNLFIPVLASIVMYIRMVL